MIMEEQQLTEQQALDTEIKTVETLMDRGVQVDLPAPRLLRLFGKKTISFTVSRPDSETLLQISGLYLRMKKAATTVDAETIDEAHLMIHDCMVPASRIVAYGMQPYITPLSLRNRLLARYLRRNMDTRMLAELWMMICSMAGAHDFINVIRSMSAMRTTKPRTT